MKQILGNSSSDIFHFINEIEERFQDIESLSDYYDLTKVRDLKNLLKAELASVKDMFDKDTR